MFTNVLCFTQSPVAPLKIFQSYINFLHFLFLCPFSIRYNEKSQTFQAVTEQWRENTVRSIYVASVCLVARLGYVDVKTEFLRNPNSGFDQWIAGFIDVIWGSFVVSTFTTFAFNQDAMVGFLNQLQVVILESGLARIGIQREEATKEEKISFGFSSKIFVFNQKLAKVLTPVLPVTVILFSLRDLNTLIQRTGGTTHDFDMKKSFLINKAFMVFTGRFNYTDTKERFSCLDYGVTASYLSFHFLLYLLTHAGYFLLLCVSFCMWIIVRALAKHIKSIPPSFNAVKQVLNNMDDMFKVFDWSEQAFGFLLCASCLGLIPMYAISLPDLFYGEFATKLEQLASKFLFLCLVFPAASVNSTISSIQTWIQYSYSTLRRNNYDEDITCRVMMIFQKLNNNSVGLSGKLFIITYGFIGNALSAIVTYAIVIIQFKNSK